MSDFPTAYDKVPSYNAGGTGPLQDGQAETLEVWKHRAELQWQSAQALAVELTAARAELEAKDKEIARLTEVADQQSEMIEFLKRELERQSVLLGKAETALEPFARELAHVSATGSRRLEDNEYPPPLSIKMGDLRKVRAVLSELQLKGK